LEQWTPRGFVSGSGAMVDRRFSMMDEVCSIICALICHVHQSASRREEEAARELAASVPS
jgi:hypothetical protein